MTRKTQLSIRVSPESLTKLRATALQEKRSVSFLIDQAIEEFVSRHEPDPAYRTKGGVPELTMRYAPLIDTAILYAYSVEHPSENESLCKAAGFRIRPEKMEYSELLNDRSPRAPDFFTLANLVSLHGNDADGRELSELFPGALTWNAHCLFVHRDYLNQYLPRTPKSALSKTRPDRSLCRLIAPAEIRESLKSLVVACESNTDWDIALGNLRRKYADGDQRVLQARYYRSLRDAFDDFTKGKVPAFGGGIVHTALLLRHEHAVVLAGPDDFDCPSTSAVIAPASIINKHRPGLEQLWEHAARWFNEQLLEHVEIVGSVLGKLYSDDPLLIQADPEEVRQLLRNHVKISARQEDARRQTAEIDFYKAQMNRQMSSVIQ